MSLGVDERWIYFIQGIDGGPIKVGIATDPDVRLKALQSGSPVKLRIIAKRRGDSFDESRIHDLLAESRSHGEWFFDCFLLRLMIAGLPIPRRYYIDRFVKRTMKEVAAVVTPKNTVDEVVAFAMIRAAYGKGYCDALVEGEE